MVGILLSPPLRLAQHSPAGNQSAGVTSVHLLRLKNYPGGSHFFFAKPGANLLKRSPHGPVFFANLGFSCVFCGGSPSLPFRPMFLTPRGSRSSPASSCGRRTRRYLCSFPLVFLFFFPEESFEIGMGPFLIPPFQHVEPCLCQTPLRLNPLNHLLIASHHTGPL